MKNLNLVKASLVLVFGFLQVACGQVEFSQNEIPQSQARLEIQNIQASPKKCVMTVANCAAAPELQGSFVDFPTDQLSCLDRAQDYFDICGAEVTAQFLEGRVEVASRVIRPSATSNETSTEDSL